MADSVYSAIYEKAARDLAGCREPDLSGFSDEDIDVAMSLAFTASGARPAWLAELRRHIEEFSDGRVTLDDADRESFPAHVKGLGVSYQRLRSESDSRDREQLLTIGQFERPFRFVRRAARSPRTSRSLRTAIERSLRDVIAETLRQARERDPR
ncbi:MULTISPECIES: hypothetical protein [unclassified Streptomyces]|uniref:hypothetical protein n=1 Tax=unclassified Streptomyces TaxID=2593676 RepID=UPI0036E1370E